MIQVLKKEECCGCSVCVSTCPQKCICMKSDEEGFLYPKVDKDRCIECGLCEKICPVSRDEYNNDNVKVSGYAAYSKNDKVRKESSSGGIFFVLAEKILNENGVVFGAAFDNNFLVKHIAVENIDDLKKIQGSKYLQSEIRDTYKQCKIFLEQGREVLFSGTACQIAGLKAFLGKDFINLFTVDVLCHGVPSPKVWKRYIREKEKEYNASVQHVEFRNKIIGWNRYSMKIIFSNSKVYTNVFASDDYMRIFLGNICLRPSCHECKFKSLDRPSDITIGDCWGIENYLTHMDDDKGTSIVLSHSKKGDEIIHSLIGKIHLEKVEIDNVLPISADSRRSVNAHPRRAKFFYKLNNGVKVYKLVKLLEPSFPIKCVRKLKYIIKRILNKVLHFVDSYR